MSDELPPPDVNPFAVDPALSTADLPRLDQIPLPVFCRVAFIVSLALCVVRGIAQVLTHSTVMVSSSATETVYHSFSFSPVFGFDESFTSWAIVLFGVSGNALMLWKRPFGWNLAILCAGATMVSLAMVVPNENAPLNESNLETNDVNGLIMLARIALVQVYCVALFKFRKWQQSPTPAEQAQRPVDYWQTGAE